MDKRFKVGIAVIACCMVGIAACAVMLSVWMLNRDDNQPEYTRCFQLAEEYAETGDYESAILSYWDAIEADNTQITPYLRLVELYEQQSDEEMILKVLYLGIEHTDSEELVRLLEHYQSVGLQQTGKDSEPVAVTKLAVRSGFLQDVADYTYEQYENKYGTPNVSYSGGTCTVTYSGLNASFYYYNDEDDGNRVNRSAEKPNRTAKPNYVLTSEIDVVFSGADTSLTYQMLESLGLNQLRKSTDSTGEIQVQFSANGCVIQISMDESGVIRSDAAIKILPARREIQAQEGVSLSGTVIDAVTGNGVSGAEIVLRPVSGNGENSRASTDGYGGYTFSDLAEGSYSVEVSKEGYIEETFSVELDDGQESYTEDFVISPELTSGEIRIVLEWQEQPSDLDSHLFCDMDDGTTSELYWGRTTVSSSGGVIATLDVDDTNGYGPETTTISRTDGVFTFVVSDYTLSGTMSRCGATVKIYLPGESAPKVVNVPDSIENDWVVCRINHGSFELINAAWD